MIIGAILAGGIGSRMNLEGMPKQFLPLGDKPIFMHTLEKFLLCDRFDAVYIGVHKDWVDYVQEEIDRLISCDIPVYAVKGGCDRNETIMAIVDAAEAKFGESDDHIIVTHDSVRPFVKVSTLNESIDALDGFDACDTVIPATDTIVESNDGEMISSIPVRNVMFQGQTPQSFRMSALKRLYHGLSQEEKSILTDACKIFVVKGVPVKLIVGDVTNIKLTTIMDYKVAKAMLGEGTLDD